MPKGSRKPFKTRSPAQERFNIRILSLLGFFAPPLAARLALRQYLTPLPVERPDWEKALIKRGQHLRLGSLSAHTWGATGSARVLLVHGWRGRGAQLGALVDPLVASGFQVVALDGPAHGDSAGRWTTVGNYARAIERVAHQLGPFHGIVAHSVGAIAATMAMKRGIAVKRFVIAAAPSETRWINESFIRRMKLSKTTAKIFWRLLEERGKYSPDDASIIKIVPQLAFPVLVIHDPDDNDVPFSNAEQIVESWPGAKLKVIHGLGHRRILKATAFIEAVTTFIAEEQ